jgi:hypothetical protein
MSYSPARRLPRCGGAVGGYSPVEQANLELVRTVYSEVLEPLD